MNKLKDKVKEIVKIAQECPENFQSICFEVLLKHELAVLKKPLHDNVTQTTGKNERENQEPKGIVEEPTKKQDDLADTDLHVKMRKFLEKYALSTSYLNQIFYKEDDQMLPLYEDLKTTRTSECQMRITLLQCLRRAIPTGDFQTEVEAARQEAVLRKCYDKNNWAGNYTNNAILFDFEKYSKSVKTVTLSEKGKNKLAELIKELQ
jgi:hypothetical protein